MGRSKTSSDMKPPPTIPEHVFGQWSTGHINQDQARARLRQQELKMAQGWRPITGSSPRALSDSGASLPPRDAVSSPGRAPSPLRQQRPVVPKLHFSHSREGLRDAHNMEPKDLGTPTDLNSVDGSASGDILLRLFWYWVTHIITCLFRFGN